MKFNQIYSIFKHAKYREIGRTRVIWRCNFCNKFFGRSNRLKRADRAPVCPHCLKELGEQ